MEDFHYFWLKKRYSRLKSQCIWLDEITHTVRSLLNHIKISEDTVLKPEKDKYREILQQKEALHRALSDELEHYRCSLIQYLSSQLDIDLPFDVKLHVGEFLV